MSSAISICPTLISAQSKLNRPKCCWSEETRRRKRRVNRQCSECEFDYDRFANYFTPLFTSSIALKCIECNFYAAINSLADWWRRSSGWNNSFRLSESNFFFRFDNFVSVLNVIRRQVDAGFFQCWTRLFIIVETGFQSTSISLANRIDGKWISETRLCTPMRAFSVYLLCPKMRHIEIVLAKLNEILEKSSIFCKP